MPSRIGVVIDGDSNTASVYFDDVALPLSSSALTGGSWFVAIAVYEQTACPAGDAAKNVGAQVFTNAQGFTGTYSDSVSDPCGNLVWQKRLLFSTSEEQLRTNSNEPLTYVRG